MLDNSNEKLSCWMLLDVTISYRLMLAFNGSINTIQSIVVNGVRRFAPLNDISSRLS